MSDVKAAVLTVSDGVAAGEREDRSGEALVDLLEGAGYEVVQRAAVPDERAEIGALLMEFAREARLVVTTGGTGLSARDVTPEATRDVVEREIPGLAEAMRAIGRASMPLADLSRGVAGHVGSVLVVNVPGSPKGATESLEAILPAIPHALEILAGHTQHGSHADGSAECEPAES